MTSLEVVVTNNPKIYDFCLKAVKVFSDNNWTWFFPSGREGFPTCDDIYLQILNLARFLDESMTDSAMGGRVRLSVKNKKISIEIVDYPNTVLKMTYKETH